MGTPSLYIAAAALALIGAFAVNSSAGLLFGLIPLALCIQAVSTLDKLPRTLSIAPRTLLPKQGPNVPASR